MYSPVTPEVILEKTKLDRHNLIFVPIMEEIDKQLYDGFLKTCVLRVRIKKDRLPPFGQNFILSAYKKQGWDIRLTEAVFGSGVNEDCYVFCFSVPDIYEETKTNLNY